MADTNKTVTIVVSEHTGDSTETLNVRAAAERVIDMTSQNTWWVYLNGRKISPTSVEDVEQMIWDTEGEVQINLTGKLKGGQ